MPQNEGLRQHQEWERARSAQAKAHEEENRRRREAYDRRVEGVKKHNAEAIAKAAAEARAKFKR